MRGRTVGMLQEILMRHGYTIQDQTRVFGADTREAVKSFQKQHNLEPTGIVDDEMMQLLQLGQPKANEKSSKSDNSPSGTGKKEKQHVSPQKLDALVRLLVKKGILEEGELEAEMKKSVPNSLF